MLDLKFIRNNIEFLQDMLENRNSAFNLDEFEQIDAERRNLLVEVENLKHSKNKASSEIAKLKAEKKDVSAIVAEMGEVSKKIKDIEKLIEELEEKLTYIQLTIPNVYHNSVTIGKNDEDNLEVRRV